MPFKAIIFDLDGTLVEFTYRFREAKKSVIKYLSEIGIRFSDKTYEYSIQDIIDEVTKTLKNNNEHKLEDVLNEIEIILGRFEIEASKNTRLHKDAITVLRKLKEKDYSLAIVTNNGRNATLSTLNRLDLTKYFDVIITRSEVSKLKPNPEGIETALKLLKVEPNKTMFVGDSTLDINAGTSGGVTVTAFTGGPTGIGKLSALGPEFIITRLIDILTIVDQSK